MAGEDEATLFDDPVEFRDIWDSSTEDGGKGADGAAEAGPEVASDWQVRLYSASDEVCHEAS